ncbi:MAG: hypothetical protein C0608_09015 [Deltaproteobacteria bacterium]|nr:MAG: hypothetical protein C0608_09015 [Deltaproteobacteria bacterium]
MGRRNLCGGPFFRMSMKKLTILMPVRNEESFLQEALDSLSSQSYGDWECLIMDDASEDSTASILAAHAKADSRFNILRSERGLGIVKALNILLGEAKTLFCARMDGDDISLPERLYSQLDLIDRCEEVALVGGLVKPLGECREGWGDYLSWVNSVTTAEDIRASALTESPLPHPTWLFRTNALKIAGGYREGPFPEDYELFLRLISSGVKCEKSQGFAVGWRDHPKRLTRTSKRTSGDAFLKIKAAYFKALLEAGVYPELSQLPLVIRGAGITGRLLKRELNKAGVHVEAFIDPVKAGENFDGAPVLSPDDLDPFKYLHLVAVRHRDSRELVVKELNKSGLKFGRDYLLLY